MTLQDLLADDPRFHVGAGGETISHYRLDRPTLVFLDAHLRPGMRTIETGAGMSTVLFALKGTAHTCIVPDEPQIARIRAYCARKGVPLEQVRFLPDRSECALPMIRAADYDLALIDGRHAFPTPFIDWFYLAQAIRVGGTIIIDDLHIWTCDVLRRFLRSEPEDWESVSVSNRAAIFRKLGSQAFAREWTQQPFVTHRSAWGSTVAKIGQAWDHVAHGKAGLVPYLFAPALAHRLARARRRG
ncbi:MAG: class I SAM-dependent methyltransferase [Candidatus Rokuibacteriota bacterium]